MLCGKEFKLGRNKLNRLGTNLRYTHRGGNPIIPIDLEQSILNGTEVKNYNNAYTEKASNYKRLDFTLLYKLNKEKTLWHLGLDIQNVLNIANARDINYNEISQELEIETFTGLLPVLYIQLYL